MKLTINYSAKSNKGLIRTNNEDTVYAGNRILAVADGMGGHVGGEIASQIIIAHIAKLDNDDPHENLLDDLSAAIESGNKAVKQAIQENENLAGMGTTLTALLFDGPRVGLAHIGDSRAYLLREGKLTRITKDDTLVQKLVEEGEITPTEALTHPQRSVIMQAITGDKITPTLTIREMLPGDRYLICSDGLTDVLSDKTIEDTLLSYPDLEEATEQLINLTLKSGAPDNVTAVIAEATESNYLQTDPIVAGAVTEPDNPSVDTLASSSIPPSPPPPPLPTADTTPKKSSIFSRKNIFIVLTLGLILAICGGLLANKIIKSTYFLAVNGQSIAVYQGLRGDILGYHTKTLESNICIYGLNEKAKVSPAQIAYYAPSGGRPVDCAPLALAILDESIATTINNLPYKTGLTGVNEQVANIITHILPPCVPVTKSELALKSSKTSKQCRKGVAYDS